MPTTLTLASLAPVLPEIFLTTAMCVVLLVDAFSGAASRRITPTLTLALIGVGAALTLAYGQVGARLELLSGMYIADPVATVLKLLSFLFVAVALLYSRDYLESRGLLKGEYYVLVLSALLGIFVIISAGSLLTLYIGVELLALSLYALVAFDRDSGVSAESAMKYFVLGAIASGCLLYGMSLLYGLSGSLLLSELATTFAGEPSLGLVMGLVFVVVGIAFKFGAVPFHMWVPDVYHGAPTPVTLFIATVPKIASFALAYRLLANGLPGVGEAWSQMITIVAVLSALAGNVIAIAQTNLKRMLAYSAIGNVGFILLGFIPGTEQGYEAALYYTLAYVLSSLGAFGVILLASRVGFEADELDHYKGLYARDPLLSVVLMVMMLSAAGIPMTVGFLAKLQVFEALWASSHAAVVVFAAMVSVIGLFYYLRVIKILFFDEPTTAPATARHLGVRLTLSLNALAVIVLGIWPQGLVGLVERALG
ncbi:MAG: NADH-quinone oxidoreductase subunit NuoN [Steroidobacteraceae bacterium]